MKIEWPNKTKTPFSTLVSKVDAGQCFLDENDNICLACDNGLAVILATGETFQLENSDGYEMRPFSAKVVAL